MPETPKPKRIRKPAPPQKSATAKPAKVAKAPEKPAKPQKKRGRKPKLTAEGRKRLLAALQIGTSRKDAAIYAGIGESTFYDYLDRGEEELAENPSADTFYASFLNDVRMAEATCAVNDMAIIDFATRDTANPKLQVETAMWRREKKDPANFGKKVEVANVEAPPKALIGVDLDKV